MTRARIVAAALIGLAVGLIVGTGPGNADPTLGVAAVAPVQGDQTTPITLTTAGSCPKGTNILTKVYGSGFPADGENVVGNTETTDYGSPPNYRLVVPLTITLQEAVRRQAKPFKLAGDYRIVITCRDPLPSAPGAKYEWGDYVATLRFGSDGRYQALTTDANLPTLPPGAQQQPVPTHSAGQGDTDPTGAPQSPPAAAEQTPAAARADSGNIGPVLLLIGGLVVAAAVGAGYVITKRRQPVARTKPGSGRPPRPGPANRPKTAKTSQAKKNQPAHPAKPRKHPSNPASRH